MACIRYHPFENPPDLMAPCSCFQPNGTYKCPTIPDHGNHMAAGAGCSFDMLAGTQLNPTQATNERQITNKQRTHEFNQLTTQASAARCNNTIHPCDGMGCTTIYRFHCDKSLQCFGTQLSPSLHCLLLCVCVCALLYLYLYMMA